MLYFISYTLMAWIFVGLGNPGEEYEGTRHNIGRDFLQTILKKEGIDTWKTDKKLRSLVAKGSFHGKPVFAVLPETFMNNSGGAVKPLIDSKKKLDTLAVLQDEMDLPLGKVKISYGSSSGGHRGIESIQKALKSKDFVRIRIGISPHTASGKVRKPDQEKVVDFVIGKFKKGHEDELKKVRKTVAEALELLVTEGRAAATMAIHSK
jgi:peptidyl-tRNA hydrolase, PTH1 family